MTTLLPENFFTKDAINGGILSIFLNVKIFGVILGFDNVIPIILILTFVLAIFTNGVSFLLKNPHKIGMLIYLFFIISFLWLLNTNNTADLYYLSAIMFALPSIIITNLKTSLYWLVVFTLCLGLLLYGSIDIYSWMFLSDSGEKMYYSYMSLPFLILAIIGVYHYRKNIFILLLSLTNLILYIPIISGIGVRGVFISIIFFFLLLAFDSDLIYRHRKKVAILFSIFCISIFSIDWEMLISNLNDTLASHEIKFYALEKYLLMFSHQDVSNGRSELYYNALSGFFESPIWGNGFGVFEANNDGLYVHNILLEVLYEGGLLLSIVFFIAIYRFIRFLLNKEKHTKEQYLFIIVFFTCGVSILLFSNTLWRVTSFWLFLGLIFNSSKTNNEQIS